MDDATTLVRRQIERELSASLRRPLVIGVSGAQGCGKSTMARSLVNQLTTEGVSAAHLSLDDFYLGRAERRKLAARLHPLFVTRGPPGTHDVAAARALLGKIKFGAAAPAPQFDKGRDEPLDLKREIPARLQVFIFEGWCLGAKAQNERDLAAPINMLETVYDAQGVWRGAVNDALGGAYQRLFAEVDHLVYLRAPNFDIVSRWRNEQERALADASPPDQRPLLMSADEISFFVQHFERVTRSMMTDLPGRAGLTLQLDERRRVIGVTTPKTAR
ncbi:MAG: hypothetical protein A3E78_07015 [Alphaproteobacteria bacterium RIFCSPHIGHO2_12_FULL_63_12]|nr:MAG: hypothetical protein A3E78_07015 [Alphaproteobacteria bacterium RIFCSPHIGHO2_12_FULL_63_12]